MMKNTLQSFSFFVEGNIGAGKSTFLKFLEKDFSVFMEPVEIWRNSNDINMLESVYCNPERYSAIFQLFVAITLHEREKKSADLRLRIFERSFLSSHNIFLKQAKRTNRIDRVESEVIEKYFQHFQSLCHIEPNLIIYLKTTPLVAFERVSKRDRSEEKSIPLSYIEDIHNLHEEWLLNTTIPVFILDGDKSEREIFSEYDRCKKKIYEIIH